MKDNSLDLMLQSLGRALQNSDNVLWIADENLSPDLLLQLPARANLTTLTNRVDVAEKLTSQGLIVSLSDFDFQGLPAFDHIIYRVSKEKAVVHHCINQALRHLSHGGVLTVIGGKQDGIKSVVKNTSDTYGLGVRARKQGVSYSADFPKPAADRLSTARLPDSRYSELRQLCSQDETFWSKPGVFGWDKVDRGSQLLVAALPSVCQYVKSIDSVLDLGCGWGYLMMHTASLPALRRVATDNNMAAITAARQNFQHAGLEVECLADDCAASLRERFDLIVCNPPFHQGFSQGDAITHKFLQSARRLSRRSTRAVFVVNQFIPLDKLAAQYFTQIRAVAGQDGFTVYELRP